MARLGGPANPRTLIRISRTDGDSSKWPVCPAKPDRSNDAWNFFERVTLQNNHTKYALYMTTLAKEIQSAYEGPELRGLVVELQGLPDGYAIFQHRTKKTGGQERIDAYVYGHPTGSKFRSTNECKDHFVALALDADEHRRLTIAHFDINPRAGQLSPMIILPPNSVLRPHNCQPCSRGTPRAFGTPRSAVKKVKPAGVKRQAEQANKQVAINEAKRALSVPAFNHRLNEVVWTMLDGESGKPKWLPTVITSTPSPVTYQQLVNEDVAEGIYSVRPISSTEDTSIKVHMSKMMPFVMRPPASQIDQDALKAAETVVTTFTPIADTKEVYSDITFTNAQTVPEKDMASVELAGLSMNVIGAYIGPEKIYPGEVFRVPRRQNDYDIEDQSTYHLFMARRFFHNIKAEIERSNTGIYDRMVAFDASGDLYRTGSSEPFPIETALSLPFYVRHFENEPIDLDWAPLYISPEGHLEPQLLILTKMRGRYYEPEAIKYWIQKHKATWTPTLLNRDTQSRAEALGWNVIEEYDIRGPPESSLLPPPSQSPSPATPRPSPSRQFNAINSVPRSSVSGKLFSPSDKNRLDKHVLRPNFTGEHKPMQMDDDGDSAMTDDGDADAVTSNVN